MDVGGEEEEWIGLRGGVLSSMEVFLKVSFPLYIESISN